jgi:hypothetical protein
VGESCHHDRKGHTGVEHLGCHEEAEIVKKEVIEASGPGYMDEAPGHKVGKARAGSRGVGSE